MKNSSHKNLRVNEGSHSVLRRMMMLMALVSASVSLSYGQGAPENLRVQSSAEDSITLNWDIPTGGGGVSHYRVRTTDENGNRSSVRVRLPAPPYTVENLAANSTFEFEVKAYYEDIPASDYSDPVPGSTGGGVVNTPPSVPGNLQAASATETSITLTWDASTDDGSIAGYQIRTNGGTPVDVGNGTTHTVTGLTAGTSYGFEIRATDDEGASSAYSPQTTASTASAGGADTVPPSIPENLRLLSATADSVTLAWDASTDVGDGMDGYRIRWQEGANYRIRDALSRTYTGLAANTAYHFEIKAYDLAGNQSAYSAQITVSTESADPGTDPGDTSDFYTWAGLSAGYEPEEVGMLLSVNLLERSDFKYRTPTSPNMHYAEHNTGNAAFAFARTIEDASLATLLFERYAELDDDDSPLIQDLNVGRYMTLLVLLEEYKNAAPGNTFYLDKAEQRAAGYWNTRNGQTEEDLLATRRLWSDDFYLSSLIDSDYYSITEDPSCLDRMARWLNVHLSALQTESGLVRHTTNYEFFWGRGCGWAALGLTEALRVFPESDPRREPLILAYRRLMGALLAEQRNDGLWGQLIDYPESYSETSGSAMFAYAFIVGLNNGWLDYDTYGLPAKTAWIGLVDKLDADGNLADVCIGLVEKETAQGYLDRPTANGDLHGQAPMIWITEALIRGAD